MGHAARVNQRAGSSASLTDHQRILSLRRDGYAVAVSQDGLVTDRLGGRGDAHSHRHNENDGGDNNHHQYTNDQRDHAGSSAGHIRHHNGGGASVATAVSGAGISLGRGGMRVFAVLGPGRVLPALRIVRGRIRHECAFLMGHLFQHNNAAAPLNRVARPLGRLRSPCGSETSICERRQALGQLDPAQALRAQLGHAGHLEGFERHTGRARQQQVGQLGVTRQRRSVHVGGDD